MRTGASAARPADVADAEAGLKAATAEYETASKAATAAMAAAEAAGAKATRAEEALAAAQRELPKLQLAAQSLRCKADDLRAQQAALDSAAAQSPEDAARLVVVRQELDAAVFALAEAQKGASSLQAKAEQLRKAMEDAGGMKLRTARAAVARLQKESEDASEGAAQRRAGAAGQGGGGDGGGAGGSGCRHGGQEEGVCCAGGGCIQRAGALQRHPGAAGRQGW